MGSVVQISTLRKIKGLESSINKYERLQWLKRSYLNNLYDFTEQTKIKLECIALQNELLTLDRKIYYYKEELELLKKEL